jgi:hypothetical protein
MALLRVQRQLGATCFAPRLLRIRMSLQHATPIFRCTRKGAASSKTHDVH